MRAPRQFRHRSLSTDSTIAELRSAPAGDEYNTLNRHYTPSGRWLSPDPGGVKVVHLDDPQTWNMYAYVRNNPTTLTDPTGLDPSTSQAQIEGEAVCQALSNFWCASSAPAGTTNDQGKSSMIGWSDLDPVQQGAQNQQKTTVVFSDNANPDSAKYRGGVERTVDYQAAEMYQTGHIGTHEIINAAKLTLHEEMDPNSKNPHQIIASPPNSQGGVNEDYQLVKAGEQYRVLRDGKVNGESAMVYDKATKGTYRYELTTLDANAKDAIKTQYTNARPW